MANVMRLAEVAEYLHVHPSTVYRLLKKHQIPAFKVGADWRFNIESLDRWRQEAETKTPNSLDRSNSSSDFNESETSEDRAGSNGTRARDSE
jgi:excisionase family DNA binding protein